MIARSEKRQNGAGNAKRGGAEKQKNRNICRKKAF